MDCDVCFVDHKDTISCCDHDCKSNVCEDCFKMYCEARLERKQIPVCLGRNCDVCYTIENIKFCSSETKKLYMKCCVEGFANTDLRKEVDSKIEALEIINGIREKVKERLVYFSGVVYEVAKICFKDRITKLENSFRQKEIEQNEHKKKCFSFMCKGYLNEDYKCCSCGTIYCKKCERKVEENHICREEDIESVKMISSSVKCLRCDAPIFVYIGCNHVTCALCGCKFDHIKLVESQFGSHNEHVSLKSSNLKNLYSDEKYDHMRDDIDYIMSKQPKEKSQETLVKKLVEYQLNSSDENLTKFIECLQSYIVYKVKNMKFVRIVEHLDEYVTSLNEEKVREIREML